MLDTETANMDGRIYHHRHGAAIVRALAVMTLAVYGVRLASAQVTDEDIERGRLQQPHISEQDIKRAQQRFAMPPDKELESVRQAAPGLDRLPRSAASANVDLGAIAAGYEAAARELPDAAGPSSVRLLIFISLSMNDAALKRLAVQAASARATLVLRGLKKDSLAATAIPVRKIIGDAKTAVQIDPQAFARFSVTSVPTFVLMRQAAPGGQCAGAKCESPDGFVKTSGDVSLDFALEHIERSAPRFAKDARQVLRRMRG